MCRDGILDVTANIRRERDALQDRIDNYQRALDNIRERARVVICGAISQYSHHDSVDGPSLYLRLAEKYSKMEGFTVMHFEDRYAEASKELLDLYKKGKLKIPYHIEDGIENFPLALQKLFTGGNTGKLMVKI